MLVAEQRNMTIVGTMVSLAPLLLLLWTIIRMFKRINAERRAVLSLFSYADQESKWKVALRSYFEQTRPRRPLP